MSNNFKNKVNTIIEIARAQGMILNYKDWVKINEAKEFALTEEEVEYYNKIGGDNNGKC